MIINQVNFSGLAVYKAKNHPPIAGNGNGPAKLVAGLGREPRGPFGEHVATRRVQRPHLVVVEVRQADFAAPAYAANHYDFSDFVADVVAFNRTKSTTARGAEQIEQSRRLWGVPRHPVQLYEALAALAVCDDPPPMHAFDALALLA